MLALQSLLKNGKNCLSVAHQYKSLYDYQAVALEFMIKKERHDALPISHTLERGPYANALVGLHYRKISKMLRRIFVPGDGVRKTVVSIFLMHALRRKTLIVVPLTIIDQWKKELKHFGQTLNSRQ